MFKARFVFIGETSDKVSEPTTSSSWCGLYADENLF